MIESEKLPKITPLFVRKLARMPNNAEDSIPRTIYYIRYSNIYPSKPKSPKSKSQVRVFAFLM